MTQDIIRMAQEEQEPVVYTGDVARTMLESGMTFHLGMPHAIVMKQMTRFYDLVCAEASLRAAAAFAIPPRREWQGLTEQAEPPITHAETLLREALPGAEWQDKHIYPVRGKSYQNWLLKIYLPVPLSAKDKSPEKALERALKEKNQ